MVSDPAYLGQYFYKNFGFIVQSSVIFGTEPKSRNRLKVTFLHVSSVHEKEEFHFLSFEDSATS